MLYKATIQNADEFRFNMESEVQPIVSLKKSLR